MSAPLTLTQVVSALRTEALVCDRGPGSCDFARAESKRDAADRIERALGVEPGKGICLTCRGDGEVWGNGGRWNCRECGTKGGAR